MEHRNERQTRTMPCVLKTRDEQNPVIEGHFAVFDVETELYHDVFETIDRGAFDGALVDDVRALINHDTTLVLGRNKAGTLELATDDIGLFGSIRINVADTDAMNLYHRVQRGDVTQCSFGFDILDEDSEYRDDGTAHFKIKKVRLYEVSVCTFPAYPDTGVTARMAQIEEHKKRALEAWKEKQKERLKNGIENVDAR